MHDKDDGQAAGILDDLEYLGAEVRKRGMQGARPGSKIGEGHGAAIDAYRIGIEGGELIFDIRKVVDRCPGLKEPFQKVHAKSFLETSDLDAIGLNDQQVTQMLRRIALDSMPAARLAGLKALVAADAIPTSKVASEHGVARPHHESTLLMLASGLGDPACPFAAVDPLSKELRATVAVALKDALPGVDPLDEIQRRRELKRSGGEARVS
jgi:hypothetical protein